MKAKAGKYLVLLLIVRKYPESHSLINNELRAVAWANLTVDEKQSSTR